MNRKKRLSS